MARITVALIGYGDWGEILAQYIEMSQHFELKYIFTAKQNTPKSTRDINLLYQKEIEAVFIASPSDSHVDYALTFLKKGKHVFCEKPLSTNVKDIDHVYELARNQGLALFINYIYLQSKGVQYLKSMISGIKEIEYIEFCFKQYGKLYEKQNAFDILGCHLLATYFYLFTELSPTELNIAFNLDMKKESPYTQQLRLDSNGHKAFFDIDLQFPRTERGIYIYGKDKLVVYSPNQEKTIVIYSMGKEGISEVFSTFFDESNNIVNSLNYFKNLIKNKQQGHHDIVRKTTKILEEIKVEESR